MKPLYTKEEFDSAKSKDKLPCQCYSCDNTFFVYKKFITAYLKGHKSFFNKYCSIKCQAKHNKKAQDVICINCNKVFSKQFGNIKKSPNHFCSKSCAASYNNKHKSHGTRRSKLEIYIENQLTQLYPNLHIDYNKTSAIGSELDIYIPSLNIAFELNGIFHYEPIYGVNKLQQIQENDISKSKACHDAKIDLCVIDTSGLKYFKPSNAQKYLNVIIDIINKRTKS